MEVDRNALFNQFVCSSCGIYVYECTECFTRMMIRSYHYCDNDNRERLLRKIYPLDEGFFESCHRLYETCSCRRPCRHDDLTIVVLA